GEPRPEAVVIWTRLAPAPLEEGGGMRPEPVPVRWQVAHDEGFQRVVRSGVAIAHPQDAHSVHVDVAGLEPGRWYWYRFATTGAAGTTSPVGRTRTTPALGAHPDRLRFAFASCANFEHGWYSAYRHMATEDLDLVVHLGDYIYEHPRDAHPSPSGNVRHHAGGETITLADYRRRLAQYRTDPDLQAVHGAFPFLALWDDHELDNNYAGTVPEDDRPRAGFRARRAAAYRAYWEHMPLRPDRAPSGDGLRLYRRVDFGRLAGLNLLDTRQYRSDQVCGDRYPAVCPARDDPSRTMLGAAQEQWLLGGLGQRPGRWNVLAQQVFMAQVDFVPGAERGFYLDGWDGYTAARRRLLGFVARRRPGNVVVLSGDFHSNWVTSLKADFERPASATVATEFVGTSISSGGDGSDSAPYGKQALADHPHLSFFNSQRGYVRCDVTPRRWRTDFRVVPYVSRPGAPVTTRASFVVEDGRAGAHRLDGRT
ncbi:MAG: alkaline phosphatase D family protein, partial [Acidimicrobiia bacterium]